MVTIYDLAKDLDLAPSTISMALNRDPRVKESTRERVQARADQVGYHRNEMARALRQQRGTLVALLAKNTSSAYWGTILTSIEDELIPEDYGLLVCNTHGDPEREQYYLRQLICRKVDGVIIEPSNTNQETLLHLREAGCPLVLLERTSLAGFDYVKNDDYGSGYSLTKGLIGKGHRSLAFVYGPFAYPGSEDRILGCRAALEEAGLLDGSFFIQEALIEEEPARPTLIRPAFEKYLDIWRKVDGIVGSGEKLICSLSRELPAYGLRVPEEISLCALGSEQQLCVMNELPISRVEMPAAEIGRVAARTLLKKIDGDEESTRTLLPGRVVWTASVAERTAPATEAAQEPRQAASPAGAL
jgi:LacI family transcriptional regulator